MKKALLLALLLLTGLMLFSCGGGEDGVPSGMIRVSNEYSDFNFFVPKAWKPDLSTGVVSACYDDSMGRDTSNVSITAFEMKSTSVTIDEYWNNYAESFAGVFSDMEYIADTETILLGGKTAQKYVYDASVLGVKYRFMQVVVINERTAYTFTYTSTPELYETHIEDIAEMLVNFSFK